VSQLQSLDAMHAALQVLTETVSSRIKEKKQVLTMDLPVI
jgi:hypothetical protein